MRAPLLTEEEENWISLRFDTIDTEETIERRPLHRYPLSRTFHKGRSSILHFVVVKYNDTNLIEET